MEFLGNLQTTWITCANYYLVSGDLSFPICEMEEAPASLGPFENKSDGVLGTI